MIGSLLNAAAILLFGAGALIVRRQPSARLQNALKGLLGVITIIVGLRATVISLGGGWLHVGKQVLIILFALSFGRVIGQLLHLQKLSNRLGEYAKERLDQESPAGSRFNDGFITASLLFCVAPLAFIGAVQDGMNGYWQTLAVKAAMDGLTVLAFVSVFGWGVLLASLPVLAYQGTLSLGARFLAQHLDPSLISAAHATAGMVVFSAGLVVLELKRISLTDYLPAIAVAPLIAWLWPAW